jgi:hypothetical protein
VPVRPQLRLVDPPTPPKDPPTGRPELRLRGSSSQNVDALDELLGRPAAPDVYQRGMRLVEVIGERRPRLVSEGTPVLRELARYELASHVERHVACRKLSKENGWVECAPPPTTLLLPMLAYGRWEHVRPVTGIVEAPFLRPDGTIRQEPGYDADTGYVYRPNTTYPAVPEHPTQEDAKRALVSLQHVFQDFPYTSAAAAAVPIACLLTILGRAAIAGPVPVFEFEASVPGSGKTMQGDVVHLIATGRFAPKGSFPEDETDQRKELFAAALGGAPVVFFDNVRGFFGGGPLEALVTSTELRQRVLGESEERTVPWRAVVIVTGNNIRPSEDMCRRSLVCRIEPNEEDPTRRKAFAHEDLTGWVASERERLIVAALTLLRAYAAKGHPDAGCGTMQSFCDWSRIVPGAIVYAGGPNVLEAVGNTEDSVSDEASAVACIMRLLPRVSAEPIGARAIVNRLYPAGSEDGLGDLREAIETLVPMRGNAPPDPHRLGKALASRKGQVSGGMRLRCRRVHGKQTFGIEPVKAREH